MAKLYKTLQDHSYISIILKPIGTTKAETISKFARLLNNNFQSFQLGIDEASEVIAHLKDILKQRSTNTSPFYKLKFKQEDQYTQWPELQILHKSQFVIGINDCKQQDPSKIKQNLARFRKQMTDERRQQLAIFLLDAVKETYYNVTVDKSFIFIPDVAETDLVSFLEMQMNNIIKTIILQIGQCIKKLTNEQNQYIVFNKNQQKPEQRTLKKKKRGRCLKLAGDYCVMIASENDALEYYKQAFDLLKRLDDYLWMMGISQGKAAIYLINHYELVRDSQDPDEISDNLKQLNQHLTQSVTYIKKVKLQSFIIQSYFIAFHAFQAIDKKQSLDQWVGQFISQQLKFYIPQDQAIYLSQIGLIYKNLQMLRKCNLFFFQASQIYLTKQPQIARMFLLDIKNSYPRAKQWKQLYCLLLKQLLKCDPNDNFTGETYAQLIDHCHSILPQPELFSLVQKLNFSYFEKVQHEFQFIKLIKFQIQKPNIMPKLNKLAQTKKEGGMLVVPRKKQQDYKYEKNQNIKFSCELSSQIQFPIAIKLNLLTSPNTVSNLHNIFFSKKKNFEFFEKFENSGNFCIQGITINIWNYFYSLKLHKPILIEVFEQLSHYQIITSGELTIEKSSFFQFSLILKNMKPSIISQKVKINISIYYSIEVGLQQNIFYLSQQQLKSKQLQIVCIESENKSISTKNTNNKIEVSLEKLKAHRQHLKKIQITVEYIKTQTSKYQINITKNIIVKFRQKIQLEISSIKSQCHNKLLTQKKLPIWRDKYQSCFSISKASEDRKVYQISLFLKDGTQLFKGTLEDQSIINHTFSFDKININIEDINKYLSQSVYLSWRGVSNPLQHGTVNLKIQQQLNKQLIIKSSKQISVFYLIDDISCEQNIITVKDELLTIKYNIQCKNTKFSHKVYLQSIEFKQTSLGYVIQGKTLLKSNQKCNNTIQVSFSTNYSNKYVLVLEFQDQIYISEKVIKIECSK